MYSYSKKRITHGMHTEYFWKDKEVIAHSSCRGKQSTGWTVYQWKCYLFYRKIFYKENSWNYEALSKGKHQVMLYSKTSILDFIIFSWFAWKFLFCLSFCRNSSCPSEQHHSATHEAGNYFILFVINYPSNSTDIHTPWTANLRLVCLPSSRLLSKTQL